MQLLLTVSLAVFDLPLRVVVLPCAKLVLGNLAETEPRLSALRMGDQLLLPYRRRKQPPAEECRRYRDPDRRREHPPQVSARADRQGKPQHDHEDSDVDGNREAVEARHAAPPQGF